MTKAEQILEAGELDWAMGELLHLIWEGKRVGVMAHRLDPPLFTACMRVIGWQPFEVRQECHRQIMGTEYWVLFRYRYENATTH
jgi:hypothetical protein